MGETTGIAWTDHTFNPWWGCTKVSPGCDHCYAETFDKRVGGAHWGKDAPRRVFGDKHWNEPKKWNAAAAKAGKRARVFCASMADVFDADAPEGQLERLWALIRETPNLDWQLLTKRPGRIARSLPADWGDGYPNVWLGTTVEDYLRAVERIPVLLSVPARVRFLSMEPLLGPVWLLAAIRDGLGRHAPLDSIGFVDGLGCGIDWVIVGGESGGGARQFEIGWAQALVRQCREAGIACFVKQLGANVIEFGYALKDVPSGRYIQPATREVKLKDRKGGDPSEWPEDLRVQQFPEVA